MNIAFDSLAALGPMSRNRGIGNYALSQIISMVKNDNGNNYFFLNLIDDSFSIDELKDEKNFFEDHLYMGKDELFMHSEDFSSIYGEVIKRYIAENEIDVFYITSPFESQYSFYNKEWFENVRTVVTVYDIIPYVMKKHYLADKTTYNWYMKGIENLKWADRILVISESVKNDLISYLGFPEKKIEVIWGAADKRFKQISISDEEQDKLMSKFNIKRNFIMCTGGDDSRKNMDGLIRGYAQLDESEKKNHQLVIVCKISENTKESLAEIARKNGIEKNVIFTGFVTDEELVMLYNLAYLVAFPSKYEGFGLPIVEAWSCGTPVLTSNNSSLCQIGGDAAVLVDADSDKSIAQGLKTALDSEKNNDLKEKGMERVKKFQWDIVAADAIRFIEQLDLPVRENVSRTEQNGEKKRIAFFSPLPPMESGISDYSVDIINSLCKYFDIDIFIDDGYTPDVSFAENVKVCKHRDYDKMHSEYFSTVYQLGNSDFHFYMYRYIKKYPGVIVLHDHNLHGAAYHYAVNIKKDYSLYGKIISEDYNDENAKAYLSDISQKICGPRIYEMPVNGFLVNYAQKIIVHSEYAKQFLLEMDPQRDVKKIFQYADMSPTPDVSKSICGLNENNFIFGAFGGIHETKRAIPILLAFSKLHKEFENARLVFAGKLSDSIKYEFNQILKQQGLSDYVTVTGYTDLETFTKYFEISDVCLNLRYPYNGETSASLMRIFGKGKCVIVNDIGSFSEFPDEICLKIPSVDKMDGDEVEYIYDAMRTLAADKAKANKLMNNAKRFAEENLDINEIAKQYYDYIVQPSKKISPITKELITKLPDLNIYSCKEIDMLSTTLAYCV